MTVDDVIRRLDTEISGFVVRDDFGGTWGYDPVTGTMRRRLPDGTLAPATDRPPPPANVTTRSGSYCMDCVLRPPSLKCESCMPPLASRFPAIHAQPRRPSVWRRLFRREH